MKCALWAYQALGWSGFAMGWPLLALKALWDPRYRIGWPERFGAWGGVIARGVWVHGASVGEVRAASPLLSALRPKGLPLLVTSTSPSGRAAAREILGSGGDVRLLPLDLFPFPRRAFRAARPRALVLVETELWPALLSEARSEGVPAALVNARISPRTFPRYHKLRRWIGPLLGTLRFVHAQSEEDAARFLSLGAPPERVSVGGNLKFDLEPPDPSDPPARALRRARAGGWRVVVGGSTHPGEEQALVRMAHSLRGEGEKIGLVLAPRHLERLSEAEREIRAEGMEVCRWSSLGQPLEAGILEAFRAGDAVLVDQYGLLRRLYGGSECAFVGGSLVPVGGHNLLEPLRWGVPVVFGVHTQNAREIRDELLRRGLGTEVEGPEELRRAVGSYLRDMALTETVRTGAKALFDANRGAAARAVAALESLGVFEG